LIGFRRKDDQSENVEIPDEFVALVAKRMFDLFGDQITQKINARILQIIKPIQDELNSLKSDLKMVKATSDDKIREFLRTTLEIHTEETVEKTAKVVINELVDMGVLDVLKSTVDDLSVLKAELSEIIDVADKSVNSLRTEVLSFKDAMSSIVNEVTSRITVIDDFVGKLEERLSTLVEQIPKTVKDNIVIDRKLIADVVKSELNVIVSKKFEDLLTEIRGLQTKIELISGKVDELSRVEDSVRDLLHKVSSLEDKVNQLQIISASPMSEESEKSVESISVEDLEKELGG